MNHIRRDGAVAERLVSPSVQDFSRTADVHILNGYNWGTYIYMRHNIFIYLSLTLLMTCKFRLVCVHQRLCCVGKEGCLVCSSKRLWNNSPILWVSLAAARAWPNACQNRQTDGRDRVPAGTWHHRAQECHCSSVTQRPTHFPGHAESRRGWNWIIRPMTQWETVKVLLTVNGNVWHQGMGEWKRVIESLG